MQLLSGRMGPTFESRLTGYGGGTRIFDAVYLVFLLVDTILFLFRWNGVLFELFIYSGFCTRFQCLMHASSDDPILTSLAFLIVLHAGCFGETWNSSHVIVPHVLYLKA